MVKSLVAEAMVKIEALDNNKEAVKIHFEANEIV